jgi:hypothetical protein
LTLSAQLGDPFQFYRDHDLGAEHRVAADAFRSVTSLSIGTTYAQPHNGESAPDTLSTLFPALRHLGALVRSGNPRPAKQPYGRRSVLDRRDRASDDVHTGVRALDFGRTDPSDAEFRKLPRRFPHLTEFVAPAVGAGGGNADVLTPVVLQWRATLTTLDLSRAISMRVGPLERLLVGDRVDGGPLAALVRLRLSGELLSSADVANLLARRREKLGPSASRVAIEWVPATADVTESTPLFLGLEIF